MGPTCKLATAIIVKCSKMHMSFKHTLKIPVGSPKYLLNAVPWPVSILSVILSKPSNLFKSPLCRYKT